MLSYQKLTLIGDPKALLARLRIKESVDLVGLFPQLPGFNQQASFSMENLKASRSNNS
jgi:hypothetical protein